MFNQISRGGTYPEMESIRGATYPGKESLKGWNLSRNGTYQGTEPF